MEIIFIALAPIAFLVGFNLGRGRESRKVSEALTVAENCLAAVEEWKKAHAEQVEATEAWKSCSQEWERLARSRAAMTP